MEKHNGINPLADRERSVRKYYEIQRKLRGNYEGVERGNEWLVMNGNGNKW